MSTNSTPLEWNEFCAKAIEHPSKHKSVWRGQQDITWPLQSGFERHIRPRIQDKERKKIWEQRDKLFFKFKSTIKGMRGDNPAYLDYFQLLALGRHFGLYTTLLDWSASPFIAAAFAVLGETVKKCEAWNPSKGKYPIDEDEEITFNIFQLHLESKHFKVLADHCELITYLDQQELFKNCKDLSTKWESPRIKVFRPPIDEEFEKMKRNEESFLFLDIKVEELKRMQGQRGYFTMLDYFENDGLENFLKKYKAGDDLLTKHTIKGKIKDIISHLVSHGIDYQLLYPDLEGAAKQANLMFFINAFHSDKP